MQTATPIAQPDLIEAAKRFAALSGPFDPATALPDAEKANPQSVAILASALATVCDTNPGSSDHWLLRTAERRYILRQLNETGQLRDAIAARREAPLDPPTEDLLHALAGEHPFAPEDIASDLADPPSRDRIERISVALDRAGEIAPAQDQLQTARSVLARMVREARRAHLRERGFFGRHDEKQRLLDWFDKPLQWTPARAAFLHGMPGIGKSALLEEMVGIACDTYNGLTVRLDFDRAGLDVLDLLGLTMEVARQIGERLREGGKELLDARLEAASVARGEESLAASRRATFPQPLAQAIAAAVRASERPVLLVLDTLEVLRSRGERHPSLLFDWIDGLIGAGMTPLRILAAGRGDALGNCPDRIGVEIGLEGLDDEATGALMDRLDVPTPARSAIVDIADGNPLVLRLAAHIVDRYGEESLPRTRLDKEVAAAFLYRFLLSRIDEPDLRALAHPGLIARRISAAFLREALAPRVGLAGMTGTRAQELFDELAGQHWLVAPDPADPEFVRHRNDMRLALLPLLYKDDPALCARIDAAAVSWFGKRKDEASQLDAAYHRLQLMRTRRSTPPLSAELAFRFDAQMITELPPPAQEVVRKAQGGRSSQFRGASPSGGAPDASGLARELSALVDRQDWAEGQYVVDQAVEAGGFAADSEAADAIRAFWWRAGRWRDARDLLAERDRLSADDAGLALPSPLALARLEMCAEFTPARLDDAIGAVGMPALLSELQRTASAAARHGALGFSVAAREEAVLRNAGYGKDADPLAAAFELWRGPEGRAAAQAVEAARERLMTRGLAPAADTHSIKAQLLATYTPYVVFAANLATQSGYEWLTEAAMRADVRLSAVGGLFAPAPTAPFRPIASNPFAGIAGLGLFAEWIAALGFARRDANLRAIGRAAENWRRTMAGEWRYRRMPLGWPKAGPLGAILLPRLHALAGDADPRQAALAQLALWSEVETRDPEAGWAAMKKRLAGTLRDAAGQPDLEAKAARLLRWSVPIALVPPIAILLEIEPEIRGGSDDRRAS